MEIYADWLKSEYRYVGFRVESDPLGTKMYCIGVWIFHVYWTLGDHI